MSPIRLSITPDDHKRSKIVKPGWFPTLIRDVNLEPNSKRDGENIVVDVENADNKSEFLGVPAKVWFTEKYPRGYVAFCKAFQPSMDENVVSEFDFEEVRGRYIYAKWVTSRGKDGTDPPNNAIEDWAPLPKAWAHLSSINVGSQVSGVAGFDTGPEIPANADGAGAGPTSSKKK